MPKVSLQQIAEAAGVSRMTVSCALRKTGRVKADTAQRIRQIAQELGYSPDARMAETMTLVRNSKKKELLPLAWLNGNRERHAWRKYDWLSPYMEGATQRATELGYHLNEFWLREPGMTEARLSSIIANRGIRGVIVTPSIPSVTHLRLDWEQFSSMSFENAILIPRLDRIAPDYYYNMMLALKMLRRLGYKRLGLCLQQLEERRSHHIYQAALRLFHAGIPKTDWTDPLIFRPFDPKKFRRWLAAERPDVVIGHHSRMLEWLAGAGYKVPQDISVVHLAMDGDCSDWAGIWQQKSHIGTEVVDRVVSMVQNSKTGLPVIPTETLIPGSWRHGKTLRSRL